MIKHGRCTFIDTGLEISLYILPASTWSPLAENLFGLYQRRISYVQSHMYLNIQGIELFPRQIKNNQNTEICTQRSIHTSGCDHAVGACLKVAPASSPPPPEGCSDVHLPLLSCSKPAAV